MRVEMAAGSTVSHQLPQSSGNGNVMRALLRASRRRIVRAARSGDHNSGFGPAIALHMAEST